MLFAQSLHLIHAGANSKLKLKSKDQWVFLTVLAVAQAVKSKRVVQLHTRLTMARHNLISFSASLVLTEEAFKILLEFVR